MKSYRNIQIPDRGKLLISEPFLYDPNFNRAVVLLTEHNEKGSVGFILNKQLDIKLKDVLPDFNHFNANLYFGGPVETNTLHFIHKYGDLIEGSVELMKGVYWGGNMEALMILAEAGHFNPNDFRFFLGYSGWGPQQLTVELIERSWYMTHGQRNIVFESDPDQMWKMVLRKMGQEYAILANSPMDPSWN